MNGSFDMQLHTFTHRADRTPIFVFCALAFSAISFHPTIVPKTCHSRAQRVFEIIFDVRIDRRGFGIIVLCTTYIIPVVNFANQNQIREF